MHAGKSRSGVLISMHRRLAGGGQSIRTLWGLSSLGAVIRTLRGLRVKRLSLSPTQCAGFLARVFFYLPTPVSLTDCGSRSPLSMIISVAFCAPDAVGVKVTEIVHFAPGASGASQPFTTL